MKKILFTLFSLFLTVNTFAAKPFTEEVFLISDNVVLTFNERLKNFTINVSNEDTTMEFFNGDKKNSILFINDVIFNINYHSNDYKHLVTVDDNYNKIIIIAENDNIFYIKDIELYKIKKIIINKKIN